MLHLAQQKGTLQLLEKLPSGKKGNGECRQHAFPNYNVRALFPNAFLRVFLIGLEGKVERSDPANENKKRRKRRGVKRAFQYAGHHVSLYRSSDRKAFPNTRLLVSV